jgi:hypothetical protein
MISSHHEIAQWIRESSPGDNIYMNLSGRASQDPNLLFQELANKDAAFAHSYEILKRAADAKIVKLEYQGSTLFVTRLAGLN